MARKMWLTRDVATSALIGLLVVASLWLASPWQRYHSLAKDPIRTQAQVSLPDCYSHATFVYRFEVGGREYGGRGHAGMNCPRLKVGEPVTVWYLRADPSINGDQEPETELRATEKSFAIMAITLPIGVFLIRRLARFLWPDTFPARTH